ncbi:hypothetical protein ACSSVY_002241 [Roseovarius sp. MBR-51]
MALAPLTQLFGQAAELAIKAHILSVGEQGHAHEKRGHDLFDLARQLNEQTSILQRAEEYTSKHTAVLVLEVPDHHKKHLTKNGKDLRDWYSFELHLKLMTQIYCKELKNGDRYASRYPPKNDYVRNYSPTIVAVGVRFLIDNIASS